ncbi:MAG: hypothetical protein MUE85_22050 [Microscillaceae bacterium]|jgi:hypothetical protein|nr:hypothetical protein [Microscillaceae bacterium]
MQNIKPQSEQEVIKSLVIHLKNLNFGEAEKTLLENFRLAQITRVLHQITEQHTGLLTYTFVNYIIQKSPSAFWHRVAACLAAESLDHIMLGHSAGLYHILQAIELTPDDWTLKEYALGFYKEGILDKQLALQFAHTVLQYEPHNQVALKISQS